MRTTRIVLMAFGLTLVSGCATTERPVVTPDGPRTPAELSGPYQVLGVAQVSTLSKTQDLGSVTFEEILDIDIPPDTEFIIPILSGWGLQFGPDTASGLEDMEYDEKAAKFGRGQVAIEILEIQGANQQFPSLGWRATIKVTMNLRNRAGNKNWAGAVLYHLLFLGTEVE